MKKIYWLIYGFLNLSLNYLVTTIFSEEFIRNMGYLMNGRWWDFQSYSIKRKFDGGLMLIFYLSIYILINIKIYKFLTRKYKLSRIYLSIPIGTMVLGIIVGYLVSYYI